PCSVSIKNENTVGWPIVLLSAYRRQTRTALRKTFGRSVWRVIRAQLQNGLPAAGEKPTCHGRMILYRAPCVAAAGFASRAERPHTPPGVRWGGGHDDHGSGSLLLPGYVVRHFAPFQSGFECPLDMLHARAFGAHGESGCRSVRAGASGAANPVDEILRR